jgi:hypothetical protein
MWKSLALGLGDLARDLVGMAGAALVAYGCWQVYQPAGFIAGGAMLIAGVAYSALAKGEK